MAWRNGSFCPGSCTALRCAPAAALRVQSPCRERDRRGSSLGSSDHKLARGKLYTISTADLITPTPSDFAQVCRRQAAAAAPAAARPPAPAAAAAASLLLLSGITGATRLSFLRPTGRNSTCLVNVRIAFLGDHRRLLTRLGMRPKSSLDPGSSWVDPRTYRVTACRMIRNLNTASSGHSAPAASDCMQNGRESQYCEFLEFLDRPMNFLGRGSSCWVLMQTHVLLLDLVV